MNDRKENRIASLDGIRGIAVLAVFAFHYINNQVLDNSWFIERFGIAGKVLQRITYFGWSGVDLFFILSGFLIGNILLTNKHSGSLFKTFYIRRFLRIIPVYYLLLIVFVILTFTSLYDTDAYIFSNPLPVGAYFLLIQNFYMAVYNHFGPQALTPTWSLCVEEQFYLIIPLLILVTNRKYVWILALAGILLAIVSRSLATNFYQGYTLLPSRMDSPMIGLLLAWLHQKSDFRNWMKHHVGYLWIILGGLLLASAGLYVKSEPGIFGHTLLGLLFGLFVAIAIYGDTPLLKRILTNKFLVEMGRVSYFMYLFHQLVNGLLHLVLLHQQSPVLDSYRAILVTAGAFLLTYLLAVVSFKYFEKPLINLGHQYRY